MRDALPRALREDAHRWAAGKWWQWRALLLALLAYTGVRHVADPEYASIFSGITLAIHEIGHLLFAPLGEWMAVAGGSIAQVAAPIAVAALLARQRDYFGVAVGGAWLSFSLCGMAAYIADARAQSLPLVSVGEGPVVHDWEYLLEHAGLLRSDALIARLAVTVAVAVLAASVAWGAWVCAQMRKGTGRSPAIRSTAR